MPSPFSVGSCTCVFVVAQSGVNVAPSEPSSSEEEEEEKSEEQSSEGSSGESSGREGESEDDLLDF